MQNIDSLMRYHNDNCNCNCNEWDFKDIMIEMKCNMQSIWIKNEMGTIGCIPISLKW